MIFENWMLLFYVFSRIFNKGVYSSQLSSSSINLKARYSGTNVILICDVQSNDASYWNIYLKCPFIAGNICYTNCKSNCALPNDCLPMISSCSIEKIKNEHIRLKWSIDTMYTNQTGDWQCSQRLNNSNSITLEKQKTKPIINQYITSANAMKHTEQPDVVTLFPFTVMENVIEKKLYHHQSGFNIWQFITQPNVVLILVCVFSLSLLLNIVFLIRCALFRSMIDNYLQAKKPPNSFLFKCFCIPVNVNPTKNVKKNAKDQHRYPYCNGYQRDDIYDDMSSGSQADKHLINTFMPCQLDQDIVYPRKVYNPEGPNAMNNRQSHRCSGQAFGNYVYVAQPMCGNRNYIQLNAPSNASIAGNSQHTYTTDIMGRSPSNEFQQPEYISGGDNVIYSQPAKNRITCFDTSIQDHTNYKYMTHFVPVYPSSPPSSPPIPPPPPQKNSAEDIRRYSLVAEQNPMKKLDLIEHYNLSPKPQLSEKLNEV